MDESVELPDLRMYHMPLLGRNTAMSAFLSPS